jgi:predicted ATP-dependent endonuclease of OLD family
MATYKVQLTVKDSYGNIKNIDGGTITIDRDQLTEEDLKVIKEAAPVYVPKVTQDKLVYTLEQGKKENCLEFDIDQSNDWAETGTQNDSQSGYFWEQMK